MFAFHKMSGIEDLYGRWKSIVFRFCLLFLGDEETASDGTLHAFLQYARASQDYRCPWSVPPLLLRFVDEAAVERVSTSKSSSPSSPLAYELLQLPNDERAVFILRSALQLSAEKTAKIFGVNVERVRELWIASLLALKDSTTCNVPTRRSSAMRRMIPRAPANPPSAEPLLPNSVQATEGPYLVKRKLIFAALVSLMVFTSGCTAYRHKPIVDRQVLRELQVIRLESLGPAAPSIANSNGLSQQDAVAVALYLIPSIRSFRKERGIAEGELVSARLLPNPEIQVSILATLANPIAIGSSALSAAVSPFRPGERDVRTARAHARIEEVRYHISAEEWKLAADVKKTYLTVWALQEQANIDETSVRLQERIRKLFHDKKELGDASRLDLNLVNLEYAQTLRQREVTAGALERARQELRRLLGLPPLYDLALKADPDPLAYRAFRLNESDLESLMIERRPQLASAKQEYEQAEQNLRIAYIQRIPWFRLGPSYEQESGGGEGTTNRLGAGLGLDLPILNHNQGIIASQEALRDKLKEGFTAQVHSARADLNEAVRNLRAQERLIRLYETSIRPALEENAELTEAGIQVGEFNLLQLITTQDKVLKSRKEFVDAELEYWKAVIDLESAIGAPITDIEGRGPKP